MSEKGSGNVRSRDTSNHLPTNLSTSRSGGNKEFNQWWEHWMSKVPRSRLSARSMPAKNLQSKAGYPSERDEAAKEKNAA
jgi:hypothetical protein